MLAKRLGSLNNCEALAARPDVGVGPVVTLLDKGWTPDEALAYTLVYAKRQCFQRGEHATQGEGLYE
jgi:hypothetical protein